MSIMDRIFVGEVVQDFGVFEEKTFGIGRTKRSALLVKKNGEFRFVIKTTSVALFSASARYFEFDLEDAYKIRQYIDQSERIAKGYSRQENSSR